MKPLFIPLKREYFEQFVSGEKRSELRLYGARWNERTCTVGRPVVLSLGYGKIKRLSATVVEFHKRKASTFGSSYQASIAEVFGPGDHWIAEIRLGSLVLFLEHFADFPHGSAGRGQG
jgi:hypothetical protein